MTPTGERKLLAVFLLLYVSTTFLEQADATPTIKSRPQLKLKSSGRVGITLPLLNGSKPWCEAQTFRQKIRHRGCETKFIANKLCYGQCWSFFIPRRRTDFKSCSFCTPVEKEAATVVLKCPGKNPPVVVKKINVINSCKCRVCGSSYI